MDVKTYFEGIEKIILSNIEKATTSIEIAMAWFTNKKIKKQLIQKKKSNVNISIRIVVDDNHINLKYFFDTQSEFENVGITIEPKVVNRFLHSKFMIIDNQLTITGSYNYSNNANKNLENIIVIKSESVARHYKRIFNFLVDKDYIDGAIKILFNNPDFGREIVSMYYGFKKKELLKYQKKIVLGDCKTFFNGMSNIISYKPGLIFNEKIKFHPVYKTKYFEFELPVLKNTVLEWQEQEYIDIIFEDLSNGYWEDVGGDIESVKSIVEKNFRTLFDELLTIQELKSKVEKGDLDLVIENLIWEVNFKPFISSELIESLFDKLEEIEHPLFNDEYPF